MSFKPLHTIDLPYEKIASGKVREIFNAGGDFILVITTDRLSAFDVILPDPIPYKGVVLNQMSNFWYTYFRGTVNNTILISDPSATSMIDEVPEDKRDFITGRSVLMKKAKVFPVECIVRGYLAGSGFKDYTRTGMICGHQLPEGLRKADRLPEAIFTPSTKATEGHDENITLEETARIIGQDKMEKLQEISLKLYNTAVEYALKRGIIIADTKFEFGEIDGEIVLIDEVLTPDSSRFWRADRIIPGEEPESYDKQIVRNWLEDSGWDKTPPAPELPEEIIKQTSEAYLEIYKKITGKSLLD